jgi:hypothetical protein
MICAHITAYYDTYASYLAGTRDPAANTFIEVELFTMNDGGLTHYTHRKIGYAFGELPGGLYMEGYKITSMDIERNRSLPSWMAEATGETFFALTITSDPTDPDAWETTLYLVEPFWISEAEYNDLQGWMRFDAILNTGDEDMILKILGEDVERWRADDRRLEALYGAVDTRRGAVEGRAATAKWCRTRPVKHGTYSVQELAALSGLSGTTVLRDIGTGRLTVAEHSQQGPRMALSLNINHAAIIDWLQSRYPDLTIQSKQWLAKLLATTVEAPEADAEPSAELSEADRIAANEWQEAVEEAEDMLPPRE